MKSKTLLLSFFIFLASLVAKADTIQFTVTVTAQRGLVAVPIGSTFTGYATYAGYFDYTNPLLAPPPLTSYAFNYPSAPTSLTALKWEFIERASTSTADCSRSSRPPTRTQIRSVGPTRKLEPSPTGI